MALTIEDKVRTSIGLIDIRLRDYDGTNETRSIDAKVDIQDQDGRKMAQWVGNLRPHLTTQQLSALATFLDAMRALAADGLLPGE